jgi:putative Mn2+ efflux pump MntP
MEGMAELTGKSATLLLIAFALGMDAFSLCIGIGMQGVRLVHMVRISSVIAVFHMVMPVVGMVMGTFAGRLLGDVAVMFGGGLLLILGMHMIYNSLRGDSARTIHYGSWLGLLAFAGSVSLDSLSVGVSLGMFATEVIGTILVIGCMGGVMSMLGLWIGRRIGRFAGEYAEALGGVILLTFGLLFLF